MTDHDRATEFLDLEASLATSGIEAVGYDDGSLNVYAVRSIASGRNRSGTIAGRAEIGGNLAAVIDSAWAGHMTFAHEIGHNLGLAHPDGLPGFDEHNLMWQGSGPERAFLTEGQIFRIHFDRRTALNAKFDLLPPEGRRLCSSGLGYATARCPDEALRAFPEDEAAVAAQMAVVGIGRVPDGLVCGTEPRDAVR